MGAILAIVVSAAAGAGAGAFKASQSETPGAPAAGEAAHAGDEGGGEAAELPIYQALPPIVVNLGKTGSWIRVEGALLFDPKAKSEIQAETARAANYLTAFLRTLTPAMVEGPSGFLHFREDVFDLLVDTSGHKIVDVIITSMVIE